MKSHRFRGGDHLCSPRTFYEHHGIYIGQNEVIHYAGFASEMRAGAIEVTTLSEFCQGQSTRVVRHPERRWGAEDTVLRAYKRLGEDWYNLLVNNCEHFANWCIDGSHRSPQAERAVGWSLTGLACASVQRQSPTILRVLVARAGMSTVINPATTTAATSFLSSSVASNVAPVLAKAAANSVFSVAVTSSVGYGGTAALAGLAGITAPVSVPAALVVGAVFGLGTLIYNLWD